MKKEKIIFFLLVISLFLLISSIGVMAEERSIYVGDLINIKITTQEFNEDELRDKFKDFEIEDIQKDDDNYIVSLRSFDSGEKTVELGDKEIKIVIKSTLDEMDRNEIFEGNLDTEETGFSINWKYIFYTLIIICLFTGGIILKRFLKKRKTSSINPYMYFINQTNNILLNKDNCFVKMTLSLKEYLESSYSFNIKGKTSLEIIEDIRCIPNLRDEIQSIDLWLKESDYYKFTEIIASMKEKKELLNKLLEIVKKIEKTKEVKV